jgi:hypothetical protein
MLFVISSLQFLIVSESAVFTVAVGTVALPLAGIWWSLFRMVGGATASASGMFCLKDFVDRFYFLLGVRFMITKKAKAVPLHATKALVGRGSIAPTHSRPRH